MLRRTSYLTSLFLLVFLSGFVALVAAGHGEGGVWDRKEMCWRAWRAESLWCEMRRLRGGLLGFWGELRSERFIIIILGA